MGKLGRRKKRQPVEIKLAVEVSPMEPGSRQEKNALAALFRIMDKVLPKIAEEEGIPLWVEAQPIE